MYYHPEGGGVTVYETKLPGCCGVIVLHEAVYDSEKCMVEFGKCIDGILAGDGDHGTQFGLAIYSLDQSQEEEAVLLAKGFEVLSSFLSPKSGNTITLYGKKVFQTKGRSTAKRRRRARRGM